MHSSSGGDASSTNDPHPSALSVAVTITPAENWHIFERTYSQSYGLILVSQSIEVVQVESPVQSPVCEYRRRALLSARMRL